ncbi:MAG TPA: DUF58 domain-containing protein [Thermoanaerobaculia bacterium]|nr:DUF58 domain-containing protein [Thermoanaerobaculia bacterium]
MWASKRTVPKPPLARRVRELEIITARLIRLGLAGEYHAAFHGQGLEFAQVREYQAGDDIRTIDWNVTARSGVPHVKQFVEERDLTVILAIDVSSSMMFGSIDRRKIDLASELSAVLAFSAEQNGDRIGMLLFSDTVKNYLPPKRGKVHVQTIVRSALLAGEHGGGATRFDRAVEFIERVSRKRAVIIFISDFLDPEFPRSMRRLSSRHDVISLRIEDPREQRFPRRGIVWLVDSESGQRVAVDLSQQKVAALAVAREQFLLDEFRRMGVDAVALSTAAPYDRTLVKFFKQRIARMS